MSAWCRPPAVIGEAMVALVLAQAFLEKFGGDSLTKRAATSKDIWSK